MTIADRIKLKRLEKDMSQTELAIRAGYNNKTAISKLEHAGDDISMKQVKRVAMALNVTPAFLMGWENAPVKIEAYAKMMPEKIGILDKDGKVMKFNPPTEIELDKAIDLYKLYSKASPEVQSAVELLLKAARQTPGSDQQT